MTHYCCKCGTSESCGAMGPYPCVRCPRCGSNLAEFPSEHFEPRPHQMLTERIEVIIDNGVFDIGELTRCVWCQETKTQIEKWGEPMEPFVRRL